MKLTSVESTFKVPLVDLKAQYLSIKDEIDEAIARVVEGGNYIMGEEVEAFEEEWARYCEAKYCVGVSSGTDALYLSLKALLGNVPGDYDSYWTGRRYEVLTTPFTFFATTQAILQAGFYPKFIDVEQNTGNIKFPNYWEPKGLLAAVPVHLYGRPVAQFSGPGPVIEDSAQAHGIPLTGKAACLSPHTKVTTLEGRKPIKWVRVGDYVLTHRKRYQRVLEVHKRRYSGPWTLLWIGSPNRNKRWTKFSLSATSEHPVLSYRSGEKKWVPIGEIIPGDWVYMEIKSCEICSKPIPALWKLCEACNPSQLKEVRQKISKSKSMGMEKPPKLLRHYYEDVLPYSEKLKGEGYRVIPIGKAIPDIIAIKDNKVIAVEVEKRAIREKRQQVYNDGAGGFYDEVLWVSLKKGTKNKAKLPYEIEDGLARVPVAGVEKVDRAEKRVYNLSVEEDESYFASRLVVHNCFSFYPTKNLGTMGQAGAVVTDNKELADKVREMRTYGERERFVHYGITGNHRMDELQAGILRAKLPHLNEWNSRRRFRAAMYRELLAPVSDVIHLPGDHPQHVYHMYVIRTKDRDNLAEYLSTCGVQTAVRYPVPMHLQPALKYLGYREGEFPNAEAWAKENLSLPMYPELTASQVEYVYEKIKEWVANVVISTERK